jgi:uncharacterized Zn-binding protein involved in type VI secretion
MQSGKSSRDLHPRALYPDVDPTQFPPAKGATFAGYAAALFGLSIRRAAVYFLCIKYRRRRFWRASMARNRGPARALCTLGAALLILTGCDRLTHNDTEWARAALERNPNLTIVAADKDANTFTVQVKGSSDLRVVRADQIIGMLPSTGLAPTVAESGGDTAKAPSSEAPPASAGSEPSTETPAKETATAGEPARPADEAASTQEDAGLKTGKGFITDASGNTRTFGGAEAPKGSAAAPNDAKAAPEGKVLAQGPGYTVTAGKPGAREPIRLAEATELKSPSNAALEQRYDPMICQGSRLLQINGRNIEFEGDGVSARDGCELHITNSHIIAHGVGLSVRAANVHIQNSIIEGDGGSVSASEGAKVFTQQSTFKGLSRRLDTATFEDLGGTNWD